MGVGTSRGADEEAGTTSSVDLNRRWPVRLKAIAIGARTLESLEALQEALTAPRSPDVAVDANLSIVCIGHAVRIGSVEEVTSDDEKEKSFGSKPKLNPFEVTYFDTVERLTDWLIHDLLQVAKLIRDSNVKHSPHNHELVRQRSPSSTPAAQNLVCPVPTPRFALGSFLAYQNSQ